MRTDTIRKVPKMTGTMETHTYSTVIQCDLERVTVFDTKRKRVSRYPMREPAALAEKATRSGAYITITGTVTDTGERMKLFGYEARRYKQNIQFTPSPNACQKQAFVMEIDGWYADLPGFSCPIKMAVPEDTDGSDCMDDIIYQVKGAVTGVALKEVKTFTMDGQKMMTVTEEVTEVKPASIEAAFFDPPADYKLAKP
jgi:hypothetical protein